MVFCLQKTIFLVTFLKTFVTSWLTIYSDLLIFNGKKKIKKNLPAEIKLKRSKSEFCSKYLLFWPSTLTVDQFKNAKYRRRFESNPSLKW